MHTSRTSLTLQEGQAPPSHHAPCIAVATQQQHMPRRVHKAAPAWGAAPARRRRHPWRRRVRRAGEQAESVDVPLGARAARLHADVQLYAHRASGCTAAVHVCRGHRGHRGHGSVAARHGVLDGALVDGGWRA